MSDPILPAAPAGQKAAILVEWPGLTKYRETNTAPDTDDKPIDRPRPWKEGRMPHRFDPSMILAGMPDAFLALDQHWCITYANEVCMGLLELPAETLVGKLLWEAWPSLANNEAQFHCRRAVAQGVRTEFRHFDPSRNMWLEMRAHPFETGLAIYCRNITRATQAEDALRDALEKLNATLDGMSDGFVTFDGQWRITSANPAAAGMAQRPVSELLGHTLWELFPDLLGTPLHTQFLRSMEQRVPVSVEIYYAPFDHWYETRCLPVPQGLTLFVTDITVRKRVQQELFEANQRLSSLMHALPVGVTFSADPTCQHITGNRVALAQFEAEAHDNLSASAPDPDAAGRQAQFLIAGRSLPASELPLQRAVAENRAIAPTEFEVVLPSGQRWFCEASAAPVHDAQGKVIGGVAVTVDITERKRSEARLAAEHAGLTRLHQLSSQLVGQVDLRKLLQAVIDAAIDLTGAAMGTLQLYDPPTRTLRIVAQCGFQRPFLDHFDIVHDGPAVCSVAMHAGQRVIVDDVLHSPIFVGTPTMTVMEAAGVRAVQATPMMGRNGSLLGMVATHWRHPYQPDEGALQRLDLLVREAVHLIEHRQREQALRDASNAKDQFMAVLSHELRTPLTPVLATSALLLKNENLPPAVHEDIQTIHRNAELEARLIDDLLDLTRVARGKLHLVPEVLDLHQLIARTVEICRSEILAKDLTLTTELHAVCTTVKADPARLQQVLWNLLKNAVKFTRAGGCVTLSTRNGPDGQAVVEIRDTGIGIEPEALPRIFDAFEQASMGRQFGGLGLGLAISKTIADLHGGTLTAHSAGRNKGATFTLTLATVASQDQPEHSRAAPRPAEARSLRILLVEDHRDTARVMGRAIQAMGHQIDMALSVNEAMECSSAHEYDLLISDIGLPDGNGLGLIQQIRRERGPIIGIALSGYGMDSDVARSREAGFLAHLTKPVNLHVLEATIAHIAAHGRPPPQE
jgi:signal transduction histidine kinase/PAS domain-containing protein/ActR/RegA family two-component response regulator